MIVRVEIRGAAKNDRFVFDCVENDELLHLELQQELL
jgi:hypothetical protein